MKNEKPKVALILQARMGSTRLPGKSMMDLGGAPLLGRIMERVKRCQNVDEIVMATTQKPQDDVLAELAEQYGIAVFRGSENDLVDRYYQAAKSVGAQVIVRLPADNPTPEAAEIDRIIAFHLTANRGGFSSNLAQVMGNGYPDGIGAEVFDTDSLEQVWRTVTDPEPREHPHLSFFNYKEQKPANPDKYPVKTVLCPEAFRRPDLVLDVNTAEEYEFMKALYEYMMPRKPDFTILDTIDWYDNVYRAGRS
ncbi:MAG: cytidylyltransferase domain-containing protein [Solirubrobacterales bacterium]